MRFKISAFKKCKNSFENYQKTIASTPKGRCIINAKFQFFKKVKIKKYLMGKGVFGMKRFLSTVLAVIMIISILPANVFASSPVNIFNITVTEPKAGEKPVYEASVPATASTYVTKTEWSGELDSNGCFKANTAYTVNVSILGSVMGHIFWIILRVLVLKPQRSRTSKVGSNEMVMAQPGWYWLT